MAKKKLQNINQLELNFDQNLEPDRNLHLGGRSFYFFDFDDNIAKLSTTIIIFNKKTDQELELSSSEFADHSKTIGREGKYKDYYMDFNDQSGSFRNFRDKEYNIIDRFIRGKMETFLEDIAKAIECQQGSWKAPSWDFFYHATVNQRPVSIITARGHSSRTIRTGIDLLVKEGHLPYPPNYLSIYAVSNPEVKLELGDTEMNLSVSELKKRAIRKSFEKAIDKYGHNPHHRFGMSDDDSHNIELISEEMHQLKIENPEMSFFVIQTLKDRCIKTEIEL